MLNKNSKRNLIESTNSKNKSLTNSKNVGISTTELGLGIITPPIIIT